MTTSKHGSHVCPSCHAIVDASTGDGTPQAGDLCICGHCATVLQYIHVGNDTEHVVGGVRVFDELDQLDEQTKADIQRARQAVALINSQPN